MAVEVSVTLRVRGLSRRELGRKARRILEAIGLADRELSVALVGDAEIQRLNREWRKRNRPTDVLSFSLREGEFGEVSGALGDVVISVDTARRQASERGLPLDEEVERLLVHGILHLAGYDHEVSEREARRMRRKEREMMRLLRG